MSGAGRRRGIAATSLPIQPTTFIGREAEAAEVRRLLAGAASSRFPEPPGAGRRAVLHAGALFDLRRRRR